MRRMDTECSRQQMAHETTRLCERLLKHTRWFLLLIFVSTLPALNACSDPGPGGGGIGGTGSPSPANLPGGGLAEDIEGIIIGQVDGFGSIIINDRRFETDDANFIVDGNDAALTDIQVGMKVQARVNYGTNIAETVHYQPTVVGPIDSFDSTNLVISVLGQTVQMNENTVKDSFNQVSLVSGTTIEVSGDRDSQDVIIAEYIRLVNQPTDFYTIGEVQDDENGSAYLGLVSGTLVNFSQLAQELGMTDVAFAEKYLTPGTLLRSGVGNQGQNNEDCTVPDNQNVIELNVETTTEDDSEIIDNIDFICAGSIDIVSKVVFSTDDQVEMVGPVSSVPDENRFRTNNVTVLTNDDTLFYNSFGVQISNIVIQKNELVLVNGIANSNGKVDADSIVLLDRQ